VSASTNKNHRKSWGLTAIVVGLFLSLLSLIVGSSDPLFKILQTGECDYGLIGGCQLREGVSIALAVLFALGGFLIAVFDKFSDVEATLADLALSTKRQVEVDLPALFDQLGRDRTFRAFPNSDAALQYIMGRLPAAKTAHNTRLVAHDFPDDYVGKGMRNEYETSVQNALSHGLVFYDLVSSHWKDHAAEMQKLKGDGTGEYKFRWLDISLPPSINFIVLEFGHGDRELIFGWAISKTAGFEKQCFLTTERGVIDFYVELFQELYSRAKDYTATGAQV